MKSEIGSLIGSIGVLIRSFKVVNDFVAFFPKFYSIVFCINRNQSLLIDSCWFLHDFQTLCISVSWILVYMFVRVLCRSSGVDHTLRQKRPSFTFLLVHSATTPYLYFRVRALLPCRIYVIIGTCQILGLCWLWSVHVCISADNCFCWWFFLCSCVLVALFYRVYV